MFKVAKERNVLMWTIFLGGDSTQFRFQFVGFVALAAAILIFLINVRRSKNQIAEQCA